MIVYINNNESGLLGLQRGGELFQEGPSENILATVLKKKEEALAK